MPKSLLQSVRRRVRKFNFVGGHRAARQAPRAIFEAVEPRRMLTVHAYVPSGGDIQAVATQAWTARTNVDDRDLAVHLTGGGSYTVDLGYGANDRLGLGSSALGVSSFTLVADQGDTSKFANVRILDAGEKGNTSLTFASFYDTYKDSSPSVAASAYNALPFSGTAWIDVSYSGTASGQRNIDVRIEGVDVTFAHTRSDGAVVSGREVNPELRPTIARPARPDASVPSTDPQWTRYNIWDFFYKHVQMDGNMVFHRGIGSLDIVNTRVTGGGKNVVAEGFSADAKIPL